MREKNIPELWLLAQKAETARAGALLNPPDDSSWNAANDDGEDDHVDIYIMMKCLCVCLFVTNYDHFRAERQRRDMRCLLGLAGRRPVLA